MSVPAIALYAAPPSGVCSAPHHSCQISSHGTADCDLSSRSSSSSTSSSAPKASIGGLSCLFASPSVLHASSSLSFAGGDDICSVRHERSEELSCSYSYSPCPSSMKAREQSPISVLQGPFSSTGTGMIGVGSSKSPTSLRVPRECGDFRAGRDRLFSGFVRNALGSCLVYDTPSYPLTCGSELDAEELTFDMDESFVETKEGCEPYVKDILSGAQMRHKIFHEEFVIKAFHEAEKAHRGQMRASGDPYLQHCVETAVLLANIGADVTVVSAGLLHDTVDDSYMDYDYIFQEFGAGVADLVEGVSKLSQLSKLARENNTASKTVEANRLHTMFLAMTDARAVLIKLADRLHNMITLDALPIAKQQRFAKETLEIFAPLANRLGVFTWKEQLENICFKYLYPQQHRDLSSNLVKNFDEAMIASAKGKLEHALDDGGVSYHALSGRHKSLYSIHSKMLKKKLTMDEIHDIHGLRLIVENDADCYKALDIVHRMWPKVFGRYKDYIKHPKLNGYQSLHTVVLSENNVPLEVQIRTREMHLQAEFGFAAHWRYKERDCKHPSFVVQMVEWARWVVSWHCETISNDRPSSVEDSVCIKPPCPFPLHSKECPFFYPSHDKQNGPVFVILLENEKMSVQEFPQNSTLMDLFERVNCVDSLSSAYSFPSKEELRPKLNHKPALDPYQQLKMGDVVELTPAIPDESLTECREEIQRMYYNGGLTVSGKSS